MHPTRHLLADAYLSLLGAALLAFMLYELGREPWRELVGRFVEVLGSP